jgi:D-sedoheptulose 7-phosphate isomerase
MSTLDHHVAELQRALHSIHSQLPRIEQWGGLVASRLLAGGRLLAAGNGGSAAQAQHLTAELVGRYHRERRPLSAIALHAETSALTAIVNDYGPDEAFARQVRAHGRSGDVLVALSTSGRSPNVIAAADAATDLGIAVLALTGAAPNPLAEAATDALTIEGPTPTVQEVHLLAIHLLCEAVDEVVLSADAPTDHGAVLDLEPDWSLH